MVGQTIGIISLKADSSQPAQLRKTSTSRGRSRDRISQFPGRCRANTGTIQLFVQSGAAPAKGKHYLLGQVQLNASQLQASHCIIPARLHAHAASADRKSLLVERSTCCITSDEKFPRLDGVGWSLTDLFVYLWKSARCIMTERPRWSAYNFPRVYGTV